MREQMSQIYVSCKDQLLKITKAPVVASGGLNEVSVVFDFCEKWDGFVKTALFYRDAENVYYAVLDDNDTCVVPWEVCYEDGYFFFSVFGEKGDTRRTSTKTRYRVVEGAITEGAMPSEPTPEAYDQIVAMFAEAKELYKSLPEAADKANAAAANAESAKTAANEAAMRANNSAEAANEAAIAANTAATKAEEATVAANNAASVAEAATEETIAARDSFLETAGEAIQTITELLGTADEGPVIVCEESGSVISLSDSSDRLLKGLTIYGKTTQDGTPTPEAPVELVKAGASGSIVSSITDGTDSNVQTITAQTPNGLPGIPCVSTVLSNIDYTDENGQKWCCDTIDFARGVYVQRIVSKVLDGTESWTSSGGSIPYFSTKIGAYNYAVPSSALSTHFARKPLSSSSPDIGITVISSSARNQSQISVRISEGGTASSVKAWFAENPTTVLYALTEPIETPLTAEELAQYAALHSNKPNTMVYNDAGAGMKIAYVADTKLYIDKKFNELAAAIVNNA